MLCTKSFEKHCWEFELTHKVNKTFRSHARQDLKKKKSPFLQFFSLQGCLPLSEISSCYSWPLYWLLQPLLLSPHCAVWKSGHLKCSLVPLLLRSIFLKQHRIGSLFMPCADMMDTPFSLQKKSLKCICVYVRECLLFTVNKSSTWKNLGHEELHLVKTGHFTFIEQMSELEWGSG